jgi:hypothetical protein
VPPGAHPAPTGNEASSAQAQTTPAPVQHEPPANGPGAKSSASQSPAENVPKP